MTTLPDQLAGTNVILMGPAGTGKTYSIGTLINTGIEVFYLAMESGLESLLGYYTDSGKPIPANLHWHVLAGPKASFSELAAMAKDVNTMSYELLAKRGDPNRGKYDQFIQLLQCFNNFTSDRTGEVFGAVDSWPSSRCIVIDGLTGLNAAAMRLVVGGKPTKSLPDWMLAQDQLIKILGVLCNQCQCHFVLIAHVEREVDQVLGGIKLTIATLGKALAPQIPAMFSDVILTVKEGVNFYWDTATPLADVKTRNLPIMAKLKPDFAQIIEKWRGRAAGIETVSKTV